MKRETDSLNICIKKWHLFDIINIEFLIFHLNVHITCRRGATFLKRRRKHHRKYCHYLHILAARKNGSIDAYYIYKTLNKNRYPAHIYSTPINSSLHALFIYNGREINVQDIHIYNVYSARILNA